MGRGGQNRCSAGNFFTGKALIQSIGPKVTGGSDLGRMRGQNKTAIQQNEASHFSYKYLNVKQL